MNRFNTKDESMNQLPKFDVAVIGGGLAGLTAALIAGRAGRSVIVFEKGPHAGGRATTQNVDGFHFNQGPHALYRGGHAIEILWDLGINYFGGRATHEGSWVLRGNEKFPMPGTPEALQNTKLFADESRQEAFAMFAKLTSPSPTEGLNGMTVREWFGRQFRHDDVRAYFEGTFRLATYCNDPDIQGASAAAAQAAMGMQGVDYLDGGWQSLVDRLRDAALAAGVRIETRSEVKGVRCDGDGVTIRLANDDYFEARTAIITANPAATARMVNGGKVQSLIRWAEDATPIYATCLDIALRRLPSPEHQFAIGLDRPLYYSVHTRSARLAPDGGAVIQLAKYLASSDNESADNIREELEAVLDRMQPGWRDELVAKRFLPRMLVANAVVTPAGRPGPVVPEHPNLFVAGDWVGPHGMLADTSLASARDAANLALQFTDVSKAELAEVG